MDFNTEHIPQINFHFQKRDEIAKAKSLCKELFAKLKNNFGSITGFEFISEEVKIESDSIVFMYSLDAFQQFVLTFEVLLNRKDVKAILMTSRADGQLFLRSSCFSSPDSVTRELNRSIKNHKLGFGNEDLFHDNFLIRFKKETPEILYAHHASHNADKKRGIDFVVGFKPAQQDVLFEIVFNLKSSGCFLEKHIRRYPKVSTFVFTSEDLNDYEKLKVVFMRFLKEVLKKGVAHRGSEHVA